MTTGRINQVTIIELIFSFFSEKKSENIKKIDRFHTPERVGIVFFLNEIR